MPRGRVKWFSNEKGYGFIEPEDGGDALFVHYNDIAETGFKFLAEGDEVEFATETGPKGPRAVDVTRVSV